MSREYYECHITIQPEVLVELPSYELAKQIVEAAGWKFSQIKGDPVLGDKILQYATKHFPKDREQYLIENELEHTGLRFEQQGLRVIRRKIELVVYDSKWSAHDNQSND